MAGTGWKAAVRFFSHSRWRERAGVRVFFFFFFFFFCLR
jgi:hypothetical protein